MTHDAQLAPGSAWSVRLHPEGAPVRLSGLPSEALRAALQPILEAFPSAPPGAGIAAALAPAKPPLSLAPWLDRPATGESASAAGTPFPPGAAWDAIEDLLWNHLLALQDADGRFQAPPAWDLSHEQCLDAARSIASAAVERSDSALSIHLPISGVYTEPGGLHFRLDTGYPQQGVVGITFLEDCRTSDDLKLRIPPLAESLQLIRNGSPLGLQHENGYLRLPGPWRAGEHVQLRFAIPFYLLGAGRRPLQRSYPGAAAVTGAALYQGARRLLPFARADAESAPVRLALGVRKDGVLLLQRDDAPGSAPFQRPGDLFLPADAQSAPAAAASVWRTLSARPPGPALFDFVPFETAFDRGAG